jgi:hypothetical protein
MIGGPKGKDPPPPLIGSFLEVFICVAFKVLGEFIIDALVECGAIDIDLFPKTFGKNVSFETSGNSLTFYKIFGLTSVL